MAGPQISLAMSAERAYVPAMSPSEALMSADELLRLSMPDKCTELVRGRLVVREPPGSLHGLVAMSVGAELAVYAKRTGAGGVFAAETGFHLAGNPDTVRAPDVAFVARERMEATRTVGYAALAPDLVVEVLSPNDRPGEVLAKVGDWLSAGTKLIWVVDPERRVARVYRHDGTETLLDADDALDGEDVLPGFSCRLATVLG
jgi:Uma2 family endonuclease